MDLSISESNKGHKVEEEIAGISTLIQRLVEDVALMEYTHALNNLDQNWNALLDIYQQNRKVFRSLHQRDINKHHQTQAFQLTLGSC
jgi:hypothetical protein